MFFPIDPYCFSWLRYKKHFHFHVAKIAKQSFTSQNLPYVTCFTFHQLRGITKADCWSITIHYYLFIYIFDIWKRWVQIISKPLLSNTFTFHWTIQQQQWKKQLLVWMLHFDTFLEIQLGIVVMIPLHEMYENGNSYWLQLLLEVRIFINYIMIPLKMVVMQYWNFLLNLLGKYLQR